MTKGQTVTAELRRYFSVGARTRRHRDGRDLHAAMIESIYLASTAPGYYTQRTHDALHPAYGSALSYTKHVTGYRIPGVLAYQIHSMSPWAFSALLGDMVDAGVSNTGEGERYFHQMARKDAP